MSDNEIVAALRADLAQSKDRCTTLLGMLFGFAVVLRSSTEFRNGIHNGTDVFEIKASTDRGHQILPKLNLAAEAGCLWLWADCGFQVIEVDERLAWSLMSTELRGVKPSMPWRSFVIKLPRRLLYTEVGSECLFAVVTAIAPGERAIQIQVHSDDGKSLHDCFSDISKMIERMDVFDEGVAVADFDRTEHERRLLDTVARLVAGVMLELETRASHTKRRPMRLSERIVLRKKNHTASHWVLSRPVVVDCREAVIESVTGVGGGRLSVRTLVRGHWRRQVCGKGRQDRKLIHIEPFWRGPEDGPIPIRPHVVPA